MSVASFRPPLSISSFGAHITVFFFFVKVVYLDNSTYQTPIISMNHFKSSLLKKKKNQVTTLLQVAPQLRQAALRQEAPRHSLKQVLFFLPILKILFLLNLIGTIIYYRLASLNHFYIVMIFMDLLMVLIPPG